MEFNVTEIILGIYVLVLGSFIGFEIISKVPVMLHTPLMSGSNAISGIILLGCIVVLATQNHPLVEYFAYFAIFFSTINVVGGFVVTDRMLSMFKNSAKGK